MSDAGARPAESASVGDLSDQLREHLTSGGTLGDWLGMGPAERAAADALARYFYQQDQYDESAQLFLWLIAMQPHERSYMLGLAAVRMMQGRYAEAVDQYAAALALDIEDPQPAFFMAQCVLKMGLRDPARDALSICLEYAKGPAHADLRARAQALLDLIGPDSGPAPTPEHRES
jgi:type III secretion system low calcium response chaperone LcrH/SycD